MHYEYIPVITSSQLSKGSSGGPSTPGGSVRNGAVGVLPPYPAAPGASGGNGLDIVDADRLPGSPLRKTGSLSARQGVDGRSGGMGLSYTSYLTARKRPDFELTAYRGASLMEFRPTTRRFG